MLVLMLVLTLVFTHGLELVSALLFRFLFLIIGCIKSLETIVALCNSFLAVVVFSLLFQVKSICNLEHPPSTSKMLSPMGSAWNTATTDGHGLVGYIPYYLLD
jgi:hypothetical protein